MDFKNMYLSQGMNLPKGEKKQKIYKKYTSKKSKNYGNYKKYVAKSTSKMIY